jgi:ribulose-5-phosphate 4-epimerase/fuculose-1-phosphate aldolase
MAKTHDVFVLKNHGLVALGKDLGTAMSLVEKAAGKHI